MISANCRPSANSLAHAAGRSLATADAFDDKAPTIASLTNGSVDVTRSTAIRADVFASPGCTLGRNIARIDRLFGHDVSGFT